MAQQKTRYLMLAYAEYFTDARIKTYVNVLNARGERVDIVCLRDKHTRETDSKGNRWFFAGSKYQGHSRVSYLLSYCLFAARTVFMIARLQLSNGYKFVHVHNQPDFLVFAAAVAKLAGARLVLDMHDIMVAGVMSKFGSGKESALYRFTRWQTIASAAFTHHIICADHSQREYLYEMGIPPSKITVLLNLADKQFFSRRRSVAAAKPVTLIYHGTLSERLGVDLIIQAVGKAAKSVPVRLKLYGAGELKPDLVRMVEGSPELSSIVEINPPVPVEALQEIIESCDIGIVGNRFSEIADKCMLPVKLLEYVRVGLPVIVPRLTVIQHYFDEDMVRYFTPGDVEEMASAIVELANNAVLRQSIASQAGRFESQYNWDIQEEQYLGVFR